MKRNITKMADEGRKLLERNRRFSMDTDEMNGLCRIYRNAKEGERLWLLMLTAFQFGTSTGYRIAKKEARKKASKEKIPA